MNRKEFNLLVEGWRSFLNESSSSSETHIVDIGEGRHVLVSQYALNHIQRHNEPGEGSVFKKGISESKILEMVKQVGNQVKDSGGLYTISEPGIGYDLVKTAEEVEQLLGSEFEENKVSVYKQERGQDVEVVGVKTEMPLSKFETDVVSLVIRPSNPAYLPEDVKNNSEVLNSIESGLSYSLLTAFPGDPDIPRASEWGDQYVVIIPHT